MAMVRKKASEIRPATVADLIRLRKAQKAFLNQAANMKTVRYKLVKKLADQISTVDHRDRGTWGGNACPAIYDAQSLTDMEKLVFLDLYLAEERKLISDFLFSQD